MFRTLYFKYFKNIYLKHWTLPKSIIYLKGLPRSQYLFTRFTILMQVLVLWYSRPASKKKPIVKRKTNTVISIILYIDTNVLVAFELSRGNAMEIRSDDFWTHFLMNNGYIYDYMKVKWCSNIHVRCSCQYQVNDFAQSPKFWSYCTAYY